jgi:hypothetical protein
VLSSLLVESVLLESVGVRAYYRHWRVNLKHSWPRQFLADRQSIDGSSAFAGAVAGQSSSIVSSDPTSCALILGSEAKNVSAGAGRDFLFGFNRNLLPTKIEALTFKEVSF